MDDLLGGLPTDLDLTDPGHLGRVVTLAEDLLARDRSLEALDELERNWIEDRDRTPLMAQLAVKLARSRVLVERLGRPFHLSVVFAVYNEHTRILTRDEHPHGEDFLREKIRQLRWLLDGIGGASWDLTIVDDGCPEGSGRIAAEILEGEDADAKVLLLTDAIDRGEDVTRPLSTADDSSKGGSILLGMWDAARQPRPDHVVLFTDADLSTHLGQAGLLIDPLLRGDADAAIGSRREPTSISIKAGTRNVRGKLFIYLWKRLFPPLTEIVDTQCGFKAFTTETAREICQPSLEKQFAFDVELLLKTELRRSGRIRKVPIAWIDSEAASTTTDIQPYLPMLRSMVAMAREYLPPRSQAEGFAALIEDLDEKSWSRLIDAVPAEIADREPHTFGDWSGVSAAELRRRAGL